MGAFALTYVDKTLLPWIGYRIGDVAPSLPNPAEYNFLIYGVILVAMMRFRPQGFLPSRQREAELSVHGLEQADLEMGVDSRDRQRQRRARRSGRDGRRCS